MYFKLDNPCRASPIWWLLSNGSRGTPNWPASIADWHELVDYAEANGLGSVVARAIPPAVSLLPVEIQSRLASIDAHISLRARIAREHVHIVANGLHEAGVRHYWLKGAAWGGPLYSRLGVRPMRDLDFVVSPSSLQYAADVLRSLGFDSDPATAAAGQHLPPFRHASGVKIDVHHRIVPPSIYGFPIIDPQIPWGESEGLVDGDPAPDDALFHLAHMVIHVFHHSFYNLRLMHLLDIKLALESWSFSPELLVSEIGALMPRRITVDILAICDTLFDIGGSFSQSVGRRTILSFLRNGSMPLGYPLSRARQFSSLPGILMAESRRAGFVLGHAPGRFGRPRAELHPPK